jgi:putative membrane protein
LKREERDPLSKTTKYYNLIRRLTFPSLRRVLLEAFLVPTLGLGLSLVIAARSLEAFAFGCLLGAAVFSIPSIVTEVALSRFVLKDDPLFYLRRCIALSLVVNSVWVAFVVTGSILSPSTLSFPVKPFLLGLMCSSSLRIFGVLSLSDSGLSRKVIASIAQPVACLAVAFPLLKIPPAETTIALVLTAVISSTLTHFLLAYIEQRGKKVLGIPILRLFRSFLLVFLDMKNEPLEMHLEKLGTTEDVKVTVLTFRRTRDSTTKATIVIPSFHPGPFLNVGSSVLPTLIQNMVEDETKGVAMVPHGVSGHENNVASQAENRKILQLTKRLLANGRNATTATKMIRSSKGTASGTGQIFGSCGLVTLTMSPKDMEDIPAEVSSSLHPHLGELEELALVDSHNCIDELSPMIPQDTRDLIASGRDSLQLAIQTKQESFKVGAGKVLLKEFSLDQGIGPGGIATVVVNIDGNNFAYITIDGNNMKKGLREKILEAAKSLGVREAEVMTTDSHMVSGRISSRLGYHPVGEAIDNNVLLSRVGLTIQDAIGNLEDSTVEWNSGTVSVKTLGRETFENLTSLIHGMTRLVAWWVVALITIPVLMGAILLR